MRFDTAPATRGRTASLIPAVRSRSTGFGIVTTVAVLVVCIAILWPYLSMGVKIFHSDESGWNLDAFSKAFNMLGIGRTIRNTVVVVALSGTLAMVIGSTLAWLTSRTDIGLRRVSGAIPIMPLFIPQIALSIGWVYLAAPGPGYLNVALRWLFGTFGVELNQGPLNIYSWWGLTLAYTVSLAPYVFLVVRSGLDEIDPTLEEAARTSGSGPLRTLLTVTIPAVKPSLGAAAFNVVVLGMAMFSAPVIIGTGAKINVLSVAIYREVTQSFPPELGPSMVLGLVILGFVALAWLMNRWIAGRPSSTKIATRAQAASLVRLGGLRRPLQMIFWLYVSLSVALPFAALAFTSFLSLWTNHITSDLFTLDNYRYILGHSLYRDAIKESLWLAAVTASVSVVVLALLSLRRRLRRDGLAVLADAVPKLPAGLPHIVTALAMIAAFAGAPLHLGGTPWILLLAYLIVTMPQSSVVAAAAIDDVGADLEEAARTCGAGHGRAVRQIVLPLARGGLAVSWVFVFVLVIGDLTVSAMLASTTTPVVGYALLDQVTNGTFPQLGALALVVCGVTSLVTLVFLALNRRRRVQAVL